MTRLVQRYVLLLTLIMGSAFVPGASLQGENFRSHSHAIMKRHRPAHMASDAFVRTQLYFGTARQDLPPVSDEDWQFFLDSVITPRFPEGLTVNAAEGQFQGESGMIVKEKSFVLLLLYPVDEWKRRSDAIEFIRQAYEDAFQQESVLRVDDPLAVRVSF